MKRTFSCTLVVLASFHVVGVAFAKRLTPPKSFVHELLPMDEIDHRFLPPVDVPALLEEEGLHEGAVPFRVAFAIPLRLGPDDSGTWETLSDGGRVWRLRISSPGARFMSFKFSNFELSEGAELHFISAARDYHDGPYERRRDRPARRFGSPMIPGDSALIELFLPRGAAWARLEIESVSHGYRDVMGMGSFPARESTLSTPAPPQAAAAGPFSCQRDINCSEGAPYQALRHAVAEGYDGEFICSGQLVNNVRQDNRYLYITAEHCEWWMDPATITYYWDYENSGCGTNDAPLTFSTGSSELYHSAGADINLLELDGTDLEGSFGIYFLGWNRSPIAATAGATLGFPDDKPMQVAIENDPIIDCSPGGCAGGFGPDFWRVEGWDVGVTEGGSSGGGLLNEEHLLVGVLTGGVGTDCDDFEWDEFAKIGPDWANLQPFLDPDDTGAMSLPGKDGEVVSGVPAVAIWGRALLTGLLLVVGRWALHRPGARSGSNDSELPGRARSTLH